MFLRNERSMGVKNGTLGTLERLEGSSLTVRLDDRRAVRFDLKDYAHVDHGYAATIHKAQGVTVDRAHVLASAHLDRHAAYVGLTRHRESVDLHWAREDLRDRAGLDRVLSRERAKDTTLDYQAGFAKRREIVPRSEIIVERASAPSREGLRRGMFAGLKLGERGDRRPAETRSGLGRAGAPLRACGSAGRRSPALARPSPRMCGWSGLPRPMRGHGPMRSGCARLGCRFCPTRNKHWREREPTSTACGRMEHRISGWRLLSALNSPRIRTGSRRR